MSALGFHVSRRANDAANRRALARCEENNRSRNVLGTLVAVGAALVPAWGVAYAMGVAPWLGYATQSQTFVQERSAPSGMSIGPRTFAFKRGQRVFVSYDLHRAEAGTLEVRVIRRGDLTPDPTATLTLERASKGLHEYRVPKSGLYTVALNCLPDANGCDVSYRASWGGLPASGQTTFAQAELVKTTD